MTPQQAEQFLSDSYFRFTRMHAEKLVDITIEADSDLFDAYKAGTLSIERYTPEPCWPNGTLAEALQGRPLLAFKAATLVKRIGCRGWMATFTGRLKVETTYVPVLPK